MGTQTFFRHSLAHPLIILTNNFINQIIFIFKSHSFPAPARKYEILAQNNYNF